MRTGTNGIGEPLRVADIHRMVFPVKYRRVVLDKRGACWRRRMAISDWEDVRQITWV